ncbi:tetratricopeptide repeat protein [Bradyrhizobium japonicum]|uniref:tetratricopeptide repeat protein n=1 Tax=Bradyrhizobium japonicum TaxID=375 RepID=UPI001BA9DB7B|nr:tetratricopeptide repeat protein [Bradyrhizobium japonicum]MBR0912686.1 tetratricopeptide repeat protein [Bradyrhizobium japonicum]
MSGKPNSPLAQLLQQAFLALRAKQFDIARQLATEALKSNRTDRNAVLILAHALLGQERAEEAIAPLEKAAKRNGDPEIETLLGHVLCAARRRSDGLAQLRRTAARRPPYLPAFQELAGQLANAGEVGKAVGMIEQALALAPASVDLQLDLGRMHVRNNNRAKARTVLTAARAIAPRRTDILTELAWAELLDGAYAEAADTYRHALGLRPDDTLSRANLAICLMEMGQRTSGETALRLVLRGRPHMLSRAAFAMATSSHGRFFFRPSAAAKFLEREPAQATTP